MSETLDFPPIPEPEVQRVRDVSRGGEAADADGTRRDRKIHLNSELLGVQSEPKGDNE